MNKKRRADKAARRQRNQRKREALAAAVEGPLNQVREQYANNWAIGHAAHFKAQGHYEWMAGFLDGCPRIVEVGTGDGSGTIALCRRGAVVVSIEKNPFCLQVAERNLREAGIPVIAEPRGTVVADADGTAFEFPTRG
jgi:predicted O-methyltransferase YrrM